MQVRVKVDGLKGLDAALGMLTKVSQARVFKPAINAALKDMKKTIKAAAPRGSGNISGSGSSKYGHLYQNVTIKMARIRNKTEVSGSITTGRGFWGYILEKGSRYMAPKPWFDNAFAQGEARALDALEERVTIELPKEFDRLNLQLK